MEKKKIFICDDDTAIADMLDMVFQDFNPNTAVTIETDSSLAYDKITEQKPDVLIVDLWMPAVSGDQLIRRIRSTPALANIFILCISASKDGNDVAMDAGANLFMPKPFDLDHITTVVDKAMDSKVA